MSRLVKQETWVDPLVCPRCQGQMRVIAVIEEQEVIRKILTHLGPWQSKARPRPVSHAPPELAAAAFDDWPASSAEDYLTDPLYPILGQPCGRSKITSSVNRCPPKAGFYL